MDSQGLPSRPLWQKPRLLCATGRARVQRPVIVGVCCVLVADGSSTLRLGCPLCSSVASLDFPGSWDLNRLVAEGTGVLHVEPLAKAAFVENVAAGHDHGEGHFLRKRDKKKEVRRRDLRRSELGVDGSRPRPRITNNSSGMKILLG